MSADNGIMIVRNEEGNYDVRYYCASIDYEDPKDMSLIGTYKTLDDAILRGQDENTEYGLHFVGLGDTRKENPHGSS